MKKIVFIILPIVILAVGFGLMTIFLNMKKETPRRTPPPRQKIVTADVVHLKDIPTEIMAYGRLTSAQPVILYSEVEGTIEAGDVSFQPGKSFKKNDLLLKIDDRQIQLDLNSAKSDLLNALASVLPEIRVDFPDDYQIWQNYFNQCNFDTDLPELPAASNQKIKIFLSRFNVYKLYFNVRDLEIKVSKHYFYAPFSGTVISADLRVGSTVRNGSRLGEIVNLTAMEVEVPVPVADVQWIDHTRPVIFTSSEIDGEWQGRINRIGKIIDNQTQTVQVYISIDNNRRLYHGLFLKAKIPGTIIGKGYVLPRKALYNEKYIYLVKNGRLQYQDIGIGRKQTDTVVVTEGIADGDTVVVEVLQGVAPGMLAKTRLIDQS